MPTFNPTGATTASLTGQPSGTTASAGGAVAAAGAAALAFLQTPQGRLNVTTAAGLDQYERLYAAAVAAGYASAGGDYTLAYEAAYSAFALAVGQAQADVAAGKFPKTDPTADPYGYAYWQNQGGYAQVAVNVQLPEAGQPADLAAPDFAPPDLGVPGPTAAKGEAREEPQAQQAPALSPPNTMTLADQMAAVPLARPPVPGGGVAPTLRRQMRKFSKRGRRF